MKKSIWFIVLACFMMFLAACGNNSEDASASDNSNESSEQESEASDESSQTVSVEHELGTTEVPKNPEKVAVFNYGTLSHLDDLGISVEGVAKGTLPSYLSQYDSEEYTNIGSLKEPDFEAIHEMDPDVIIMAGRQGEAYEDLSDIAPTVYISTDTEKLEESYKNGLQTIGEIFGKETEVEEKINQFEETATSVQDIAQNSDKKGLVVLSSGGKLSAYGKGSRFGIIHDVFGVIPVTEEIEASTHGMEISFEYISKQNPDYLFVIDRDQVVGGESAASEVLDNELVNGTNAAQDENIFYLDPEIWYLSSGLPPVGKMAEEIKTAIQE
ncbi:iron complex transport system substrate-binding protein [Halobacillus alkaliphilus]|uniref:Iron complex transport system substrate-binding protein n=1 Tax=Halobacillus alkaliphilus TaxID=396056 RepID=A0A1I2JRR7_9BACI|nr:siderophore ABC transporter substrate-binding protein [Halobacillus alkaliphilus]SFF56848.1 iron complex transport system substrate-binding protein [Halobacillus alkaliphilus]